MAGKKISGYTNTVSALLAADLIDVSKRISSGPDVFESQKAPWDIIVQEMALALPVEYGLTTGTQPYFDGTTLVNGPQSFNGTDLSHLYTSKIIADTGTNQTIFDFNNAAGSRFLITYTDGLTSSKLRLTKDSFVLNGNNGGILSNNTSTDINHDTAIRLYAPYTQVGQSSATNGVFKFANATNAFLATIQSGVTAADYTLTLPTSQAGGANYALVNDGAGALSWYNIAGALGAYLPLTGNAYGTPITGNIFLSNASAKNIKQTDNSTYLNFIEFGTADGIGLGVNDLSAGYGTTINFANATGIVIQADRPTFEGVRYDADYSAYYTVRSLPDKAYVVSLFGGASPTEVGYISGATSSLQNQINNMNSGLSWKVAAKVLVGTNVTISSPGATIDGVTMASGDRMVLNGQSTGSQNGVYVWNGAAVPATRSTDCATGGIGSTGVLGMTILIEEGTSADQIWMLSTNAPITIGSTTLTYARSSATTYTSNAGVSLIGNNFSLDNSYFSGAFTLSAGVATIGNSYVTNAMLAGSIAYSKLSLTGAIVNADLAGSITNAKLSNSTISGISLGSNLAALTIGTGLSGTSYNGSAGITIAIDSTVATLTGAQALTNKTYNGNTWTAGNGTLTIAASKTLTVNDLITLASDGTGTRTLNIGAGGTLGSNAFTSTTYAPVNNPTFTGIVIIPALTLTLGSDATGDIYYNGGSGVLTRLAAGAAGKFLMYNGAGAAPIVSTLVMPNSITAGRVVYGTAANTLGSSANYFYDSATQQLLIGTETVAGSAAGVHVLGASNTNPQIRVDVGGTTAQATLFCQSITNGSYIQFDAFGSAAAGTIGGLNRTGMASLRLQAATGGVAIVTSEGAFDLCFAANSVVYSRLTVNGNTIIGSQVALATNATDGFVYIPTSAGGPTGTPTSYTGKSAMEYDTTNNILKVYNGGWRNISTKGVNALFDHYTNVGNSTTTETDLYSDSIAAGQLAANGDKISAEYGGNFVSSGTATREVKIYFGGTAIFDTGALTLSLSAAWTAYVTIIRVSSSVVRYNISLATEGAALAAYTASGELTGLILSNANVLKITGQAAGVGAATNDIVANMGLVEYRAAA